MEQTYDNLKDRAKIIRNELEDGANTGERVGGLMEDMVDTFNSDTSEIGRIGTLVKESEKLAKESANSAKESLVLANEFSDSAKKSVGQASQYANSAKESVELTNKSSQAATAAATEANNAVAEIDTKIKDAIEKLIEVDPDALDSLNELIAALGDDPNLATTILTEIGKKLGKTDLVSDPTIGGIDKPASAESVKVVNNKAINTQNLSINMDTKAVILLYEIVNIEGEQFFTTNGVFYGKVDYYDSKLHHINLFFNISHAYEEEQNLSATVVTGYGFHNLAESPKIVSCTYQGKKWVALDVSTETEAISYYSGYTDIKNPFKVVAYISGYYDGGPNRIVNQEINDSILVLSDKFEKIDSVFKGIPEYIASNGAEEAGISRHNVFKNNLTIWQNDYDNYQRPDIDFIVSQNVNSFEAIIGTSYYSQSENESRPVNILINGKKLFTMAYDTLDKIAHIKFFKYYHSGDGDNIPRWGYYVTVSSGLTTIQ